MGAQKTEDFIVEKNYFVDQFNYKANKSVFHSFHFAILFFFREFIRFDEIREKNVASVLSNFIGEEAFKNLVHTSNVIFKAMFNSTI